MRSYLTIWITFVIALGLCILPWPQASLWWRPAWLAISVIFWVIAAPDKVSLGSAWVLGLLLDVLYGTVLGEHALALVLIAFLSDQIRRNFRMYFIFQQALWICPLVLIYQLTLYTLQGMFGNPILTWKVVLPAVTSMFVWPVWAVIFEDIHFRFCR